MRSKRSRIEDGARVRRNLFRSIDDYERVMQRSSDSDEAEEFARAEEETVPPRRVPEELPGEEWVP